VAAKLPYPNLYNPLRAHYQRGMLSYPPPHLLYANLEFGTFRARKDGERLLRRLKFDGWTDQRILTYLEKHQEEFRSCLEWLSNGSEMDLADRVQDASGSDELLKRWAEQPEVRFLQLHGFDHGGVQLKPHWPEDTWFSGIEIDQKKPRDPLDSICWYLVSRLMVTGTVGVLRCKYARCGKFFEPRTVRKRFCSNACRANAFMSKKSPEEKRKYMRKWRAHPKRKH
jgi:hypothetical protein